MRITVSHNKPKEEVIQTVDRSFTALFQAPEVPVKLLTSDRTWKGSTMSFSLTAKLGFLSTPIKGTVEVTDREIIIDADLGVLERMMPADKARDLISSRVRGLLQSQTERH
jgi:Putative polyhydroxyalkanoic acid system protein (PHA_gran_rgn)